MNELTQQRIAEITTYHEQWKSLPATRQFYQMLEQRENNLTSFISSKSTDKETTDQQIRLWGSQIQELKQIKRLINDTKYYVEKITAQS